MFYSVRTTLCTLNTFIGYWRLSVHCFEYIFAGRCYHQESSNLNLSHFYINKECYSITVGASPSWALSAASSGQHIQIKWEGALKGLHYAVSVSPNKSVEPPLDPGDCSVKDPHNRTLTDDQSQGSQLSGSTDRQIKYQGSRKSLFCM